MINDIKVLSENHKLVDVRYHLCKVVNLLFDNFENPAYSYIGSLFSFLHRVSFRLLTPACQIGTTSKPHQTIIQPRPVPAMCSDSQQVTRKNFLNGQLTYQDNTGSCR